MAKLFKLIVWILGVFVFLILIFGVYAIPLLPIYKNIGENAVANQIAGMNYMLTFLALVGAVAGIGFTVFGYYESKKFPELIKQEVQNELDKKEKKVSELNARIKLLNDKYLDTIKGLLELSGSERGKKFNEQYEYIIRAEHLYQAVINKIISNKEGDATSFINEYRNEINNLISEYVDSELKRVQDYDRRVKEEWPYRVNIWTDDGVKTTTTYKVLQKYKSKKFDSLINL